MSTFQGIERRVRQECNSVGEREAHRLELVIAKQFGFNPQSTWWAPDDFQAAMKPLKAYAARRFAEMEFQRVWSEAEKAALEVLKKGKQP